MSTTTPEVFRTAESRFADLPGYAFEPHYLDVDGLRMHYLDEGLAAPHRWCAFMANPPGPTCTAKWWGHWWTLGTGSSCPITPALGVRISRPIAAGTPLTATAS